MLMVVSTTMTRYPLLGVGEASTGGAGGHIFFSWFNLSDFLEVDEVFLNVMMVLQYTSESYCRNF